jgi:hypothetical protein
MVTFTYRALGDATPRALFCWPPGPPIGDLVDVDDAQTGPPLQQAQQPAADPASEHHPLDPVFHACLLCVA